MTIREYEEIKEFAIMIHQLSEPEKLTLRRFIECLEEYQLNEGVKAE